MVQNWQYEQKSEWFWNHFNLRRNLHNRWKRWRKHIKHG